MEKDINKLLLEFANEAAKGTGCWTSVENMPKGLRKLAGQISSMAGKGDEIFPGGKPFEVANIDRDCEDPPTTPEGVWHPSNPKTDKTLEVMTDLGY